MRGGMRARPEPAFAPPGKRRRYFKCPFVDDKPGWKFVRRLVGNCVFRDFRKSYRWSLEDRAVVKTQAESARIKHLLSLKVYERWRQMRLCQDDAGGKVPGGKLLLRPYALFQLSLDRVDNDRPHFPEHELQNLHFVPLGMNTPKSVVGVWGKHACRCLRERVEKDNRNAFPARADVIFRRAAGIKNNKNTVYKAARNIYSRDGTTRAHFETFDFFFEYVISLLKRQRGRCAVSSLFMDRGDILDAALSGAFSPSLDAINPKLGHTRGNLRWVCAFLNSTNMAKCRTGAQDVPAAWTAESFRLYIGNTLSF